MRDAPRDKAAFDQDPHDEPQRDYTLRPALEEIAEQAAMSIRYAAPEAYLVRVFAVGLDEAGRCDLARESDFLSRWEFAFYDPGAKRWLTVAWLSTAYVYVDRPDVCLYAGNVAATEPLSTSIAALPTSSELADWFREASDVGFEGTDEDSLVLAHYDDADVLIASNAHVSWRTPLHERELGVVSTR